MLCLYTWWHLNVVCVEYLNDCQMVKHIIWCSTCLNRLYCNISNETVEWVSEFDWDDWMLQFEIPLQHTNDITTYKTILSAHCDFTQSRITLVAREKIPHHFVCTDVTSANHINDTHNGNQFAKLHRRTFQFRSFFGAWAVVTCAFCEEYWRKKCLTNLFLKIPTRNNFVRSCVGW